MRKIHLVIAISAVFSMQHVLAADDMSDRKGPCADVVKACFAAGYARKSEDKRFWFDCMNPILLGKTVKGVNLDPNTVKMCRANKIEELKKELSDLQAVSD